MNQGKGKVTPEVSEYYGRELERCRGSMDVMQRYWRGDGMSDWGFDMFRLRHLESPMVSVIMAILRRRELFVALGLEPRVCERYFAAIEKKYAVYPSLAYHTSLHAADVAHSLHNLMDTECLRTVLSPLQVFSALVAAVVHDVGHPGLTNQFLCATGDPLAILYNDMSVLENHHAATAFLVAREPECDIFACLSAKDRRAARDQIIYMIMSTDMAKHSQLMSTCRVVISELCLPPMNGVLRPAAFQRASADHMEWLFGFLLHLADLGACTKPWPLCQEWAGCIMMELFVQGDKEVALGLSPTYDRNKTTVPQSQLGFLDYIVRPLWAKWDELIGVSRSKQTLAIEENRRKWSFAAAAAAAVEI